MKKLDCIIRPATIADIEKIHYVLSEAFKPYKKHYTKEAYNATVLSTDTLVKRITDPELYVLVALFKDKIVGTTTGYNETKDCLHISTMAVDPQYQKKGVGYKLLEYICSIARENKVQRISLESYEPLKRAIAIYENYGFKKTNNKRTYHGIEIFEMIKLL
jgi:[ribosomal protein S18]-alanine N-acetyltransferase